MARVSLSKRAEADLFDIFLYGCEVFGEAQARRYAEGLDHAFGLLAENPRMGRAALEIADGVRRHLHAMHVILYEPMPDGVRILALVHARSVERLRL